VRKSIPRRLHRPLTLLSALIVTALLFVTPSARGASTLEAARSSTATSGNWSTWQKDLAGSRYAAGETAINARNVGQLENKWAFTIPRLQGTFAGSQPAIVDGSLYVGSTDAKLYALDAKTGATRWAFDLSQVVGPVTSANPDPVRDGPAVADGSVFFGDSHGYVYAVDQRTGRLRWATPMDTTNPEVRITSSPIVFQGRVFIGLSNQEAGLQEADQSYPCCTARGQFAALDARTGKIVWRYYTVPQAKAVGTWPSGATMYSPSGGSVWSAPVISPASRTIFFGTAQNYTGTEGDTDSVLALDLDTGHVRWKYKAQEDTYTTICDDEALAADYCPSKAKGTALDWDISSNGNLFRLDGREVLGIGAKSGKYWLFDARTGRLLWSRQIVANKPGGNTGMQWGSSYDGKRIYVATWFANPGTLYALDPATGRTLWETPTPADGCTTGGAVGQSCGLGFTPAVTTTPGLVFEGNMDGKLYAFSSTTGELLWQYDTVHEFAGVNGPPGHGQSISGLGGAVVADGMVYVESGYYPIFASPTEGTVLLAFGLPGRKPGRP
jgi:polyvinyl alcohol dehydrogenase (cytochrome)